MEDAHEIVPGIFLGNVRFAKSLPLLLECGITHIVNCAQEIDNPFTDHIKYKHFPLYDDPNQSIGQYFEEASTFIDDALRSRGKVLVHCYAGISRSVAILTSYLMKTLDMTSTDVIDRIHSIRNIVNPNMGFRRQLIQYYINNYVYERSLTPWYR